MEPNELPDELMSLRQQPTYTVPPGYFDELSSDILSKVHMPLSGTSPLAAPPAGYFDTLADTILSKIKTDPSVSEVQKELEEIDSFVAGISRENVYRVPQDYFTSFAVPVSKQAPAPVVKMNRRPAKWIMYAAAAIITGIVATGGVLFLAKDKTTSPVYNTDYKQVLAKVTDKEIADYLDNTASDGEFSPVLQPENSTINDSKSLYKQLLNNVSDNEIQNYLNANNDSDEQTDKGI